jgi:V/A-type H+-transporting ATPase subunit I
MAKVRLVSPRNLLDRVVAFLQEAGVLHIDSAPAEAVQSPLRPQVIDEATSRCQAELQRLQEALRRLLLLLPEVPLDGPATSPPVRREEDAHGSEHRPQDEDWQRMGRIVRQIEKRVDYLVEQVKQCEEELALLSKYEKALEALAPFLRLIRESEEFDHLGITLEETERQEPLLHDMMATVTDNRYELFHSRLNERTTAVLLVFPTRYSTRIRELLWERGISELRLPASVSDKPLSHALRIILKKKVDLLARASRYRADLLATARAWRLTLLHFHDAVTRRLQQIEVAAYFYQTELTSFMYGWVPRRAVNALRAGLATTFGGQVVLDECPVAKAEWETVPVVLRNPPWLRPFESLTRLIALPRYGSIDPTPYLAVFFPLLYGMILGDVGYGLVLLGAAAAVRHHYRRNPLVRDLSLIGLISSGAAVLFGLLFGELFGELGTRIGLHPVLDRMQAFVPLLYLSLGIGAIHVSLGIVLGALWAWRQGDRHECFAKGGALLLVMSFAALIGSFSGLFPATWTTAASAGLLTAVTLIAIFGGTRGALELHNLINVLSYLRLMGIGVASTALAYAANRLGGLVGNVLLALVIGATLHLLNLVFGLLSPTIQSLRLHYVEFFENFFAPGGRPYQPFKRHSHWGAHG